MKPPNRTPKPIQLSAITLPWKQLPDYPDIGSWKTNADNSPAFIAAADTGNDISNAAILLHEFVESILCWLHDVKEEDVSRFDKIWFEEQELGLHKSDEEPGYDSRCPYLKEHVAATVIERWFVEQCGMTWSQHEENCDKIS